MAPLLHYSLLWSVLYPLFAQKSWNEPNQVDLVVQQTQLLGSHNHKSWMDQCRMIPIQHTHLGSLNQEYVYYFLQDHTNTVAEESCSSIHGVERPESCVIGLIKLVNEGAGNVCILTKEDAAAKSVNKTINEADEYRSTIQQLSHLWDEQCRQEVASLFGSVSRFQLQRLWLTIDGFVHQMRILGLGQASTVYVEHGSHTVWLHRLFAMMGVEPANDDGVKFPSAMIVVLSNPCLTSHLQSSYQTLHACSALQLQIASTLQYVQQRIQQQPTLPILLIIHNYHSQFHQPMWASLLHQFPWHAPFMPNVGVYQPIQIFRRLGSGVGPGIGMLSITMDEPRLFLEHNRYMLVYFYPHLFGTCTREERKQVEEIIHLEGSDGREGERLGVNEGSEGKIRMTGIDSATKTCFFPPPMHTNNNKKERKKVMKRRKPSRKTGLGSMSMSGWYNEDDLNIVMTSLEFKHILRHPDKTNDADGDGNPESGSHDGGSGGGDGSDIDSASNSEQQPSSSSSSSQFPTNPHPPSTTPSSTSIPIATTPTPDSPVKRSCLIISVSYGIHFPHWAQQAFLGDKIRSYTLSYTTL